MKSSFTPQPHNQPKLAAAIVAIVAVVACFSVAPSWFTTETGVARAKTAFTVAEQELSIQTDSGAVSFKLELAVTPDQTARGLMFRRSMPKQQGMLFFFGEERLVQMWMKNTYIPLDMVFLNSAGRIVHVHKGAVPHSLDVISSQVPARFVLEVNAGEAQQFGLKPGQQASHPWFQGSK